tara:strand:+ start:278 stop:1339 length:1062 start_codon:yes stop_codon:yes gene_type:complete
MAYTTVDKSTSYHNSILYTGTSSTWTAHTGVGFSPEIAWFKKRSGTAWHNLMNTLQGVNRLQFPNSDESGETGADVLQSFDADGFTVGQNGSMGADSGTYTSWCWNAGTTTGISGGTITPSAYTINTTSGVGCYTYTGNATSGATIAHGLGAVPKFLIIKCVDTNGTDWVVWSGPLSVNQYLYMNSTANEATDTDFMNSVLPSSTLITLGDKSNVNGSSKDYVMYVFTEIQGFSKFGYYIGNGTDTYSNRRVGPFIYTGFKPSFVMVKQTSGSGTYGWYMFDNKRAGYNPDNEDLLANTNAAEDDSNNYLELESNGFKIRTSGGNMNTYNSKYIYMAFGQALVGSNGVVGTAR